MCPSIIGSHSPVLKPRLSTLEEISHKLRSLNDLVLKKLKEGGLPRTAEEFLAFETFVHEKSCEFQDAIVAPVVVALNEDPAFQAAALKAAEDLGDFRRAGHRSTTVRTLGGGSLTLNTPYLAPVRRERRGRRRKRGRRGKAGGGAFPVLLCLGIQWGATPGLCSEVARHCAECGSYDAAQRNLEARGIRLDTKTIRRLAMAVGTKGLGVRASRLEQARCGRTSGEFRGKVIVVSMDGGRMRCRVPKRRGRRRVKTRRRGFEAPWREPKCFAIYEVDANGRKSRGTRPIYEATLGEADTLFEVLLAELKLRGAREAKRILFLGDGAEWLWNRIPELIEELGIDPARVHKAIDYWHACQHLHEIAELRKGWSEKRRKAWATRMSTLLRAGKVDRVIAQIKALCRGRNARHLRTQLDYFVERKRLMAYDRIRRLGLPMGSGCVESAIRRIVNLRLKGCGIFWLEDKAEAMLYLRARAVAGRWDETVEAMLTDLPVVR